jgi:transposase
MIAMLLPLFMQLRVKNCNINTKDLLSDFKTWNQLSHAKQWLIFPKNIDKRLSIYKTSLSNGELYTIAINKAGKRKKTTIVAVIAGTKAERVISFIEAIPLKLRNQVTEITLDMAANMGLIATKCFPTATQVTDRFHIQKLAFQALQEIRIKYRWQAIDEENNTIEKAKKANKKYKSKVLTNGDTLKQLLARSRYFLYKKNLNSQNCEAHHEDQYFNKNVSKTKWTVPLYYLNYTLISKKYTI